ncbi:ABC-2 transporter permease [Evansella cellulosilytica]|uniref:ABC-2 transporter permease n=1 Tax=Evansella cellulosilytica (strain ATCC 21833 / DSM 2522 / FERM P-1141 / JCM 9156 / N-4) TaxID=649639 RepID=E6TUT4_EVAC2|nr:ABC-2 transporter permease [Evansella cellulosilytica]ADU32086.1 hypothetical protein Bcell_3847 [Evansella cellulosilytica DSM 2522]
MFNLIRRDAILQKKMLLTFIPFILFFIIMDIHHPAFIFLVASLFIPFNAYSYDEKAETNILLNSLPYTRKEIIAARYLGSIFYTLLAFAVTGVTLFLFNKPFTLTDIAIGGGLFLIFAAFTFPLFYILKPGHIATVVIIIFLALAAVGPHVFRFLAEHFTTITAFLNNLTTEVLYVGAAAIILTLYAISWVFTTIIYQRKAF